MGKRIAVVGAGAVGGYVGAHLARLGQDVTLIDPWPEHIEALRARGLEMDGVSDEDRVTVREAKTMHLTEAQVLGKQQQIDMTFVSTKSYNPEWPTNVIPPYPAPAA